MDSYDSDSSLSDTDAGTSTNVLLGFASDTATDDPFSQLGGEPSWLDPSQTPAPTLAQCKVCNSNLVLLLQLNGDLPERFPGHERRLYIWGCRSKVCRRKPGSIRVTRGVKSSDLQIHVTVGSTNAKHEQSVVQEHSRQDIGNNLFGGQSNIASSGNPFASNASSNPFSKDASSNPFSSSNPSNPFASRPVVESQLLTNLPHNDSAATITGFDNLPATFAAKASISEDSTPRSSAPVPRPSFAALPWPERSQRQKPYRGYYLDADYEYLSGTPQTRSQTQYAAFMDIDSPAASTGGRGKGGEGEKEDAHTYESEHDQAFQHFADILAQNPEQVLRYEFGGSPLLFSRSDSVGHIFTPSKHDLGSGYSKVTTAGPASPPNIPKCANCGSLRIFEVQLMPHAIAELEADEDIGTLLDEGMEWGTIIVGVCSKDCGSGDGMVEYLDEWVGVQWEEVVSRGKGKV